MKINVSVRFFPGFLRFLFVLAGVLMLLLLYVILSNPSSKEQVYKSVVSRQLSVSSETQVRWPAGQNLAGSGRSAWSAGQQVSRSTGQPPAVHRQGGQQVSRSAGRQVDRSAVSQQSTIRIPQSAIRAISTNLPLYFEPNQGQANSDVKFLARGPGILFTRDAVVFGVATSRSQQSAVGGQQVRESASHQVEMSAVRRPRFVVKSTAERAGSEQRGNDNEQLTTDNGLRTTGKAQYFRMKFAGANPNPEISGVNPLPGTSNYFVSSDPAKWKTNVPQYARVQYKNLYPGIDLIFYGSQQQLEYDLVVSPGADPSVVALQLGGTDDGTASVSERRDAAAGMERQSRRVGERGSGRSGESRLRISNFGLRIDVNGDLVIGTSAGEIRQLKPKIYQEINGVKFPVPGRYVLKAVAGSQLPVAGGALSVVSDQPSPGQQVHRSARLSSVIGQRSSAEANRWWSDGEKRVGERESAGVGEDPTRNSKLKTRNFQVGFQIDAYDRARPLVIDPQIIFTTTLQPNDAMSPSAFFVDALGNSYGGGFALATDLPNNTGLQPPPAGGNGVAYVVKIGPTGTILFSTYLGPGRTNGIAVDASGNIYLVGQTGSANFPTRNPIQPYGGHGNAFITKLNPSGNALIYSTFLGGSSGDEARAVAVDAAGNAYVAGKTSSSNFPLRNAIQSTLGPIPGIDTGFISKLNPAGSALVYSTYFGIGPLRINSIAVDSTGGAYVTGSMQLGGGFNEAIPSPSGFQRTPGGGGDEAFVAKLNSAGSALVYSSYLGGSDSDFGNAIAVDASGNAYVAGSTFSANFPTLNPIQATRKGTSDAFIAKLAPSGSALVYSTYLGGSDSDNVRALALDLQGRVYAVGGTRSADFPLKNPIQNSGGGFVTQLSAAGNQMEFSTYVPNSLAGVGVARRRSTSQKAEDGPSWRNQSSSCPGGDCGPCVGGDCGLPDCSAGDCGIDCLGAAGPNSNLFSLLIGEPLFPPPTELFEDSCVKILKKDGHLINGHAAQHLGQSLSFGYKVVPERSVFGTNINDAFQFANKTEDKTGHKLDFEPGDSVLLNPEPCHYKQNVIFPAANAGGGLRDNELIGSGIENTIIEDDGQPFEVQNPSATLKSFTWFASSPELGINFTTQGGDQATVTQVRVSQAGLTVKHRPRVLITDSKFVNALLGSIGIAGDEGGSSVIIDNVEILGGLGIYGNNVQSGKDSIGLAINKVTMNGPREVGRIATSAVSITGLNVDGYAGGLTLDQCTGSISKSKLVKAQNGADSIGLRLLDIGGPLTVAGVTLIGESGKTENLIGKGIAMNGADLTISGNTISQYLIGIDVLITPNPDLTKKELIQRNVLSGNRIAVLAGGVTSKVDMSPAPSAVASSPLVIQDNSIFGNRDSGIRAADPNVDIGGGPRGSAGGNLLLSNGQFDLINESGSRISAKNNLWASSDPNQILTKFVSPGAGVDVAPVMPVQARYFAQFAEAPAFTSTLTLTNPSRTNGAATLLAFRNSAGTGVNVPLNGNDSPKGLQPGTVAPLGSRSFSTNPTTTVVNVGSMTAASGRPLAGTVLFSGPAGVAGVGASELLNQFIAPVEKSASKSVNSGIAITNPSTTAAVTVALRLRENSTAKITESTLQLPAGGQAAKFIDELFSGLSSEFNGTLSVSAPAQVAATVIRTSPAQFATLPVTGAGAKKLFFAQFGEVTGISSTLTFVNPSLDKTASVTVKIFDDNGSPLTVNLGGQDRPGQFTFSLPPQSSVSFASPGTSTAAKVGSVVVDSTENIGGTILFGGSFGLAGVGASQALANFIAPVEQTTQGGVTVGLALMNTGTTQVTVKLTLRDESGTPIEGGTTNVTLPSQAHVAKFIGQFFPNLSLADFRGTITGEATGGQIGATVIRQSGAPLEFATLPVAEIIP